MDTNFNITGDINTAVDTLDINDTPFTYSALTAENQAKVDAMVALMKDTIDVCCKFTINHTDAEIAINFTGPDPAERDPDYHTLMDYDEMSDEDKTTLEDFLTL